MDCRPQCPDQLKPKKLRQPAQDLPQVEPDRAQHRVEPIAFAPAQVAGIQQAFVFHVADDRLNAVAPVLVAGVGGTVAFLLAGDVNVGQRRALAAAITPVAAAGRSVYAPVPAPDAACDHHTHCRAGPGSRARSPPWRW